MSETVLAPFTAADGENLALYEWPLGDWYGAMGPHAAPPRGVVLIVHGLGEHAGRYQRLVDTLLGWGFAVRAYDQRGHGESSGARGALPAEQTLIDDLAEMVDDTRARIKRLPSAPGRQQPLPLILFGHSLGGLVASRFVSLADASPAGVAPGRPVDALVLSSPALLTRLSVVQRMLLAFTPLLVPNLQVSNGLDARYLSHDPAVIQAYNSDPQVHAKISPRLGQFIAEAGPATLALAPRWHTPTLLLYAGDDHLVNPEGSRQFAAAAAASADVQPGLVTAQCFDGLYHELFNELHAEPVFDALKAWLDARF